MNRTKISIDRERIPDSFHPLLDNSVVYDSSCSEQARVYFIDKDGGYYLKSSPKGTLGKEAALTRYFHQKGLAAEVLAYESLEQDWLLTRRVKGEDCTYALYMDDPIRLCDTISAQLRMLHDTDYTDCPIPHHTADYLETAKRNYQAGQFDLQLFTDDLTFATAEEAWKVVERDGHLLKTDTLLHGDYCLPNIMLDDWRFSGFIDLDNGGVGDRHIDLFWGMWTLQYNLKTDRYRHRFLDGYGRDKVEEEMFRVISAAEVFG